MNMQLAEKPAVPHAPVEDHRSKLLSSLPLVERRLDLGGVQTSVLVGGNGPSIILLHGPGESSLWWMRVIPELARSFTVVAPDLPGHGESRIKRGSLQLHPQLMSSWLQGLIKETCPSPPVLVGHLLGGAIATRFTIEKAEQVRQLVLVNAFGLAGFRPSPAFAFRLIRFMLQPTEKNYERFLPHCLYDSDKVHDDMGGYWKPFFDYNMECARDPDRQAALSALMKLYALKKISPELLAKIPCPTALIWGRHDLANKLRIAEEASRRFNWPLTIIENCRDDPKFEQPKAFVEALKDAMKQGDASPDDI